MGCTARSTLNPALRNSRAIRAEAPIFAADDVIAESAIEFEGEEVDEEQLEAEVLRFRSFLEDVTPDQFVVENGDEED